MKSFVLYPTNPLSEDSADISSNKLSRPASSMTSLMGTNPDSPLGRGHPVSSDLSAALCIDSGRGVFAPDVAPFSSEIVFAAENASLASSPLQPVEDIRYESAPVDTRAFAPHDEAQESSTPLAGNSPATLDSHEMQDVSA